MKGKFICLELASNGRNVLINIDTIVCIYEESDGIKICTTDGDYIKVNADFDDLIYSLRFGMED